MLYVKIIFSLQLHAVSYYAGSYYWKTKSLSISANLLKDKHHPSKI